MQWSMAGVSRACPPQPVVNDTIPQQSTAHIIITNNHLLVVETGVGYITRLPTQYVLDIHHQLLAHSDSPCLCMAVASQVAPAAVHEPPLPLHSSSSPTRQHPLLTFGVFNKKAQNSSLSQASQAVTPLVNFFSFCAHTTSSFTAYTQNA
jgi:hypothetical protein